MHGLAGDWNKFENDFYSIYAQNTRKAHDKYLGLMWNLERYYRQYQIILVNLIGFIEYGLGYKAVFDVLENCVDKTNIIYFDNIYTTLQLTKYFSQKNTYSFGSICVDILGSIEIFFD